MIGSRCRGIFDGIVARRCDRFYGTEVLRNPHQTRYPRGRSGSMSRIGMHGKSLDDAAWSGALARWSSRLMVRHAAA